MHTAILDTVRSAAPAAALAGAIVAVAALVGAAFGRPWRTALWTALVVCLAGIGLFTLGSTIGHAPSDDRALNLVPFQEIDRGLTTGSEGAERNLVGNVLLFIPLGVIVAWLVRGSFAARAGAAVAAGLALSVAIEVTQYGLGRVADIDDVLLNTGGALAGGIVGALVAVPIARARRNTASGGDVQ